MVDMIRTNPLLHLLAHHLNTLVLDSLELYSLQELTNLLEIKFNKENPKVFLVELIQNCFLYRDEDFHFLIEVLINASDQDFCIKFLEDRRIANITTLVMNSRQLENAYYSFWDKATHTPMNFNGKKRKRDDEQITNDAKRMKFTS